MTTGKSREERIREWLEEAEMCARANRPDLVPTCLTAAAVLLAEGEQSIAEMLESVTWTA